METHRKKEGKTEGEKEGKTHLTIRHTFRIIEKLYRGVAKLGIALGSGPRGLGFKSPHSDHTECSCSI